MGEESGSGEGGVEDTQVRMQKLVGCRYVQSCWSCGCGLEGTVQKDLGTGTGPRTYPKKHQHQERKAQSSVRGKILRWAQKHSKGMAREAERPAVLCAALELWYLSRSTQQELLQCQETGCDKP